MQTRRLLALLVFVPMFLVAWYTRAHRAPAVRRSGPAQASTDGTGKVSSAEPRRGGRSSRRRAQTQGTPGDFDFYLLNLSWSPEYCHTHAGAPECAAHAGFVLHGLWPQNDDGTYPEHCSDAPGPANPAAFADIYPDSGLLAHE